MGMDEKAIEAYLDELIESFDKVKYDKENLWETKKKLRHHLQKLFYLYFENNSLDHVSDSLKSKLKKVVRLSSKESYCNFIKYIESYL